MSESSSPASGKTMQAIFNGKVLAESDETLVIEGNHYFPPDSIKKDYFSDSDFTTVCPWKGEAHYYSVNVDGKKNEDAAWYYPKPKAGSTERAGEFTNYVAFWNGVEVREKE